ncbi:biogenesis of lysosome-related organelles complex 1 subunit 4 isoform X2 [Rhynchophorus ferrugineus]|uniref:biogenesis of lysosome-related organelles complex 1 subunit 4 isoform X2 n=1 Tax=Rhynchophorus ferrugineus TaxID=354439 RepID=UPI003FCE5128
MRGNEIKKTSEGYSKLFTDCNLEQKLVPINKSIEQMLARLEEFETMFAFIQPDIKDSKDLLNSIMEYKSEFDILCEKIDNTELLVAHVKHNLDTLEARIEESEAKLNVTDTASKVTNLLTPLLFANAERKPTPSSVELFKTEDYFM